VEKRHPSKLVFIHYPYVRLLLSDTLLKNDGRYRTGTSTTSREYGSFRETAEHLLLLFVVNMKILEVQNTAKLLLNIINSGKKDHIISYS